MKTPKLNSQSGQGVTEYLLILIIVMVIILGLVYQFNDRFKQYAETFFDGYVACLLETGELPGASASQCKSEFPGSFAQMNGKMLVKFKDGSDGTQASKSGKSDTKSSTPAKTPDRNTSSGRPSEIVRSSGRSNNFGNFGQGGKDRSTAENSAQASKSETDAAGYGSLSMGAPVFVGHTNSTNHLTGVSMYDDSAGEARPDPGKAAITPTSKQAKNGNALKPKKAYENTSRGPASAFESESEGFSFGAMLRWLIIAALILAIVIFFGSQLMSIMRSREKGGD